MKSVYVWYIDIEIGVRWSFQDEGNTTSSYSVASENFKLACEKAMHSCKKENQTATIFEIIKVERIIKVDNGWLDG